MSAQTSAKGKRIWTERPAPLRYICGGGGGGASWEKVGKNLRSKNENGEKKAFHPISAQQSLYAGYPSLYMEVDLVFSQKGVKRRDQQEEKRRRMHFFWKERKKTK